MVCADSVGLGPQDLVLGQVTSAARPSAVVRSRMRLGEGYAEGRSRWWHPGLAWRAPDRVGGALRSSSPAAIARVLDP
jgi:hypothetical protein